MAKDGLLQLKELQIQRCLMMEEVFSINDGEGHIIFPKLEKLSLFDLPSLTTLCKGIESIHCPVLTEMVIIHCPKLISFVSSTGNSSSLAGHYDDSLHFFCNQKVTFGSLQILRIQGYENINNLWCHKIPPGFVSKLDELNIYECGSIRSLFPSSMARNLVNLKTLSIWECNEMVKVIGDDEENICENSQLMFPSLEELYLKSLPNLVNFCGWRCALHLPSLTDIEIYDCPRMESFTKGSLTTRNLKSIEIDYEQRDVEDLNGAVQLYFRAKVKSLY